VELPQELTADSSPLVAILGPTGSGKSEAGLRLAGLCPIEIVNCDSVQIYRRLDIGTAKLRPHERLGIPHHMMDIIEPGALFTAGEYARRARPILRSITRSGRLPVVVGGTGFYLKALLDGLFHGPGRDETLRRRLAARQESRPGFLHRLLRRLDPDSAARIHPNDANKLIRALEVCIVASRPVSKLYALGRQGIEGYRTLKIVLEPPRQPLYDRLDQRAARMFDAGLVEEVESLLSEGVPPGAKALESLGYRQAVLFLRGNLSREEAVDSTQRGTRRYAKRQLTWFRKEPGARWISGFGDDPATQETVSRTVAGFLKSFTAPLFS